mgnify:CR=1 FL=1
MENKYKLGVSFEEFANGGGTLNFGTFTNFEKAISAEEFGFAVKEGVFSEIYDEKSMRSLCNDITAKAVDMVKAGNIEGGVDLIEKARKDLSKLVKKTVVDKTGKKTTVWVHAGATPKASDEGGGKEPPKTPKVTGGGKEPEDTDIKKAEENDIEKALDSFSNADNLTFKKTGEEIKEKLILVKEKIETCKSDYENKNIEILAELREQPTLKPDEWDTKDIEQETKAMRLFEWCKTHYSEGNKGSQVFSNEVSVTSASSKEEADMCDEYNRNVRKIFGCLRDLKKIGVLERNLEDKKTYDLSVSQAREIGF